MPEEAKPKAKGGAIYRSQFSMGQLDFERYDRILSAADEYGIRLENNDLGAIRPFYAVLKQFYRQIRFIVRDRVPTDELSARIETRLSSWEEERKMRRRTEHLVKPLLKDVRDFADKVYEMKQWVGLGIEVNKVLSRKQMWERAARID